MLNYNSPIKENKNYLGKSVFKAVENINGAIAKTLNNIDINNQTKIDKTFIDLDGSEQKKKLGANAILAVSMASCKLAAIKKNISLFKYLGNSKSYQLPIPLLNIINGGVHAKNNLDIQEFMIRPEKVNSFSEAMRRSFLVIQNLKGMIDTTNVGDEGGFAPNLKNTEEAIKVIIKAIEKDSLTWSHVSDLHGWNSAAGKLYAVNAIPHSVILNENGTIVAKNLRGEELRDKIAELLN